MVRVAPFFDSRCSNVAYFRNLPVGYHFTSRNRTYLVSTAAIVDDLREFKGIKAVSALRPFIGL